ncbi:unnamed protein product, partial [marine sediment metagenome]
NRAISANAGRSFAMRMTSRFLESTGKDKLSMRALKRLGLNPQRILKNKGMVGADFVTASQHTVNATQFRAGALDLPLWFSSPEGKLIGQFKTFAFNQSRFTKNMLKEEVAKGNWRPVITAVTAMPILGEGVKDLRGLINGTVRDEKGL